MTPEQIQQWAIEAHRKLVTQDYPGHAGQLDEWTHQLMRNFAKLVHGEHYDQQAMELCEKCGWKAVMPGEPCLLCSKPDPVQAQTPPPRLAEAEIIETARSLGWWTADKEIADDALRLSRAIEAAVRKQFWGER